MGGAAMRYKVGQEILVPMRITKIEEIPAVSGAIFTCRTRAIIGAEHWEGGDPKYYVAMSELRAASAHEVGEEGEMG